jgi:long-subunit fatty acid transport protein
LSSIAAAQEFGQAHTLSGLIGAIWQVNDKLSFDVGFRHAIMNGSNVNEIRAGLTVGFMTPFGRPPARNEMANSAASAMWPFVPSLILSF